MTDFGVRKRVLAACITLMLVPLCVEGLLRLRQFVKHGTLAISPYKLTFDPKLGFNVPVPGKSSKAIWINSLGFRSPELVTPKPPNTIRVAFLGASTTFCGEVNSNSATWPGQVARALQSKWPDATFDYLNAAVPAITLSQSLGNLTYRVKPHQPDVIIIYQGDLTADTRKLAEQQGLPTGRIGPGDDLASWSLAWDLLCKNLRRTSRVRSVQNTKRLQFDVSMLDKGEYPTHLRALLYTAKSIAPVVAVATLSIKARRNQPAEEQLRALQWAIYYTPFMTPDGIIRGYDEYNHIIRTLAQETSVTLVADEDSIPGDDEHFKDAVHFTDAGCVLMAGRVVTALAHSTAFQRLIQEHRYLRVSPTSRSTVTETGS
jgi:lysophospholipase L1-like esterase